MAAHRQALSFSGRVEEDRHAFGICALAPSAPADAAALLITAGLTYMLVTHVGDFTYVVLLCPFQAPFPSFTRKFRDLALKLPNPPMITTLVCAVP